jgi:hypothetical protein
VTVRPDALYAGALVQKVTRPRPGLLVLHARTPGRSVLVAVIGAREGVAIGEIAPVRGDGGAADATLMRLRKQLEGARVLDVARRPDGSARLRVVRGGEVRALVATREGVALVELPGAPSEGDAAEVIAEAGGGAQAEHAARVLARLLRARFEEERRALHGAIARARKKLEKRLEALAGDLAKIERADEHKRLGALLIAVAARVPRGAREVELEDWTSGERVVVRLPLDPAKSAKDQAEGLFHKAKRLERGRTIAEARRAEAARAVAALTALEAEALAAEDERTLGIVRGRAQGAGVSGARVQTAPRPKDAPRVPYNSYTSGGHRVLVGRGAADNDALTTKVAKPHDLWLHAKNVHGAHVIVPLAKGASVPSEVLVDAAHLAAHFSDARGEKVVEVQHTPRRYVRKPKGSAPGAVVLERESVIVLRVEPGRVERLLATGE